MYALPLPPAQEVLANPPFGAILQLIYNRLSAIPLMHPLQEITVRKFNALEALYNQLSHLNTDLGVWRECLQAWYLQHANLINTHRGQAVSFATATARLVDALFELTRDNRLIYPI